MRLHVDHGHAEKQRWSEIKNRLRCGVVFEPLLQSHAAAAHQPAMETVAQPIFVSGSHFAPGRASAADHGAGRSVETLYEQRQPG